MVTLIQKIVNLSGKWQHLNGDIYTIIGVGNHVSCCPNVTVFSQYCRHGKFTYLSSSNSENLTISLYQYGEEMIYSGNRDVGEIVFYSGNSGRWARTKEIFLGEKFGRPRFVKLDPVCPESVLVL